MLGIGASFLVPLFLNTISSQLLDDIRTKAEDRSKNILVFLGFCLVAAISSKTFIQTISKRVLATADKALRKASKAESDLAPLLAKETEGDEPEKVSGKIGVYLPPLSDPEWKVLEALAKGDKALRTRGSLARQTGIGYDEVCDIVDILQAKGLAASKGIKKSDGRQVTRRYITAEGREIVETRSSAYSAASGPNTQAPQN